MELASPSSPAPGPDAGPPRPEASGDGGARRRGRRRRAVIAALVVSVLAAAVAAVVVLAPPAIRREIIAEARARGVALDPGAVDLSLGAIRLRGARFSLLGVRGLSGTIARATIELRGLSPARIAAEDVAITVAGVDALEGLPAWAAQHGARAAELPLAASRVRLGYRDREGAPEVFALADATFQRGAGGPGQRAAGPQPGARPPEAGVLRQARVLIAGKEVARTDVGWSLGAASLSLGFGGADVPSAPLRAELRPLPSPSATLELAPAPLPAIAALLGVDAGASPVIVSGTVDLRLAGGADRAALSAAPLDGAIALTLKGFTFPHPKELDGLLFGDTTTLKADAHIPADRQRVALSRVEVAAGALKLGGAGEIQRAGADASIGMDLSGSVPCSLLAGSAAKAHLTGVVGLLAGDLARRALAGSVSVQVRVDARASRLTAARVTPRAIPRCKVRL
ncbi:hypothetical protein SOCE26_053500 [Sorangium cellulosum]|uniref:AsmA-like C-terminal domain-containing protein n=1 Tax=Sorangium cellulosum TaxID=56 RepID=A0A2L0EX54_SORCE|nr:hypothetical protein [Sorangium cellulosum]AUX43894.1 hypothetical protein SOCE26_053500 [Sorangium cellulosum]